MHVLELPAVVSWEEPLTGGDAERVAATLEAGDVVALPGLAFALGPDAGALLDPAISDGRSKNISLAPGVRRLSGARRDAPELAGLLRRFAASATGLSRAVYADAAPGATSFRPVEALGREARRKTDDRRLHVDAFPSRPTGGARILRVFTNVSPDEERVWRIGEPFETVTRRFASRLGRPSRAGAFALKALGVTRGLRSPYDQFMLNLHDAMKRDDTYQESVPAATVSFAPGMTWLVFTDQVSHAVVSGQFVLEQTLFVPVRSLRRAETSPFFALARARPDLRL
jgi:3-deoxy-D-manno-oct-2-ulosonic acid (Kdo) hydroxylase